MGFVSQAAAEAARSLTAYLLAALLLVTLLARGMPGAQRRFLRGMWAFFVLHAVLVPLAVALRLAGAGLAREALLAAHLAAAICAVQIATFLVFVVAAPRAGVASSRILKDVVTGFAAVVAGFWLASRAGFNVSGLIATSAVLTAVVGFALRDTLGNVIGGLSLQTDRSIRIGDWIKVGDVIGRVVEIRWRYTAVETRNWETLIVPNGVLTTEKVLVLGRRTGQPEQLRRWIHFNVDHRFSPAEVVRVVTEALAQPMDNVAAEPPPHVVLMDLGESYARYAARYWLTELAFDDGTDTVVRTRVYFALRRAGIPLSPPAHAVFLTEQTRERAEEKRDEERRRRLAAVAQIEILRPLDPADREALAGALEFAPFAAGELLTRQGDVGHWLFLIVSGEVAVRVSGEAGLDCEVARLRAGDFFGEMSLMTGERRSATVVAVSAVACYRLDKQAFEGILRRSPEVAEPMAEILARRRGGLSAAREGIDQEARARRVTADTHQLLSRIRDFFGLG